MAYPNVNTNTSTAGQVVPFVPNNPSGMWSTLDTTDDPSASGGGGADPNNAYLTPTYPSTTNGSSALPGTSGTTGPGNPVTVTPLVPGAPSAFTNPSSPSGMPTPQPQTMNGGIAGVTYTSGAPTPTQALSDYLANNPNNPQAAIDQFNQNFPGNALAPAWEAGSQTIGLGDGTYLVAPGTGGNTGTTWQVVQRGNEGGGAAAGPTPSLFPNGPLTDPNATALFNTLMTTANEGLNVTPNDPVIQAQTAAYSAAQQRQMLAGEQQVAAQEGPYANLTPAVAAANETTAQNTSGFQANLMATEIAARRQEIESALSGAQGLLTAEQQMQLQEELSNLQLQEQAYQFDTTNNSSVVNSLINSGNGA